VVYNDRIGLLFTKHIFSQGHFQTLISEAYMFEHRHVCHLNART